MPDVNANFQALQQW